MLVFIAVVTMFSGIGQLINAPAVLHIIGAESTKTPAHFFAIIGMFMFLFGGLLVHALRKNDRMPVLWCALQKFGAAIAVGLGVYTSIFSAMALAVAGFDLLSGILIMIYYNNLKRKFIK